MTTDRSHENGQAVQAARDPMAREAFLEENQTRILGLAGKIAKHSITKSDDEWTISMLAVSDALDHYDQKQGDFWPFASVVIRNRLSDHYRGNARAASEITVSPEVFSGEVQEEDAGLGLQLEVREKTSVTVDFSLRDEIEALSSELETFGISFFDLAETSPRAEKTRKSCARLVCGMFLPPPLVAAMRRLRKLPLKDLLARVKEPRKVAERHRSYLVTATLILDGDYPKMSEYIDDIRQMLRTETAKEAAVR